MPYVNNKGTDQPAHSRKPAHSRSLINAFVVRCLDIIIPLVSISEISSRLLVSVAERTSSSLTWSQTPKTGFLVTRLIKEQSDLGMHCFLKSICSKTSEFYGMLVTGKYQLESVWAEFVTLSCSDTDCFITSFNHQVMEAHLFFANAYNRHLC